MEQKPFPQIPSDQLLTRGLDQLITRIVREAVRNEIGAFIPPQAPAESAPTAPEYLTRKQTATRLAVSIVTISDWTKTGKLQGYRIGSRVRYKASEIDGALKAIVTAKRR
jgi:excisionase family DNA binding protein